MQNWESLISERSRPCATMPREPDERQRARKIQRAAYHQRIKCTPEYKEKHKKWQKACRHTDKYRKHHREYMKEWRKTHPLTDRQKEMQRERNKRYKERKKAKEAA